MSKQKEKRDPGMNIVITVSLSAFDPSLGPINLPSFVLSCLQASKFVCIALFTRAFLSWIVANDLTICLMSIIRRLNSAKTSCLPNSKMSQKVTAQTDEVRGCFVKSCNEIRETVY
jgi:hypothetical protein